MPQLDKLYPRRQVSSTNNIYEHRHHLLRAVKCGLFGGWLRKNWNHFWAWLPDIWDLYKCECVVIVYILPRLIPTKCPPAWPVLVLQHASDVWVSLRKQPSWSDYTEVSADVEARCQSFTLCSHSDFGCRSKFWQKRYGEVSMWNNSNFEGYHEIGIVSVLKGFFSQENLLMSGLTCVISLFRAYFSLHCFACLY